MPDVPPLASSFCAELPELEPLPAIHFPGGAVLQPTIDTSKGVPDVCALVQDLTSKLDSVLAPFQPLFDLLDLVSTLATCVLIIPEAITNPLKLKELFECLPSLVAKLNKILALIPILPQGIQVYVTFVVDVLRYVGKVIECVARQVRAAQAQIALAESYLAQGAALERQDIIDLANCGLANGQNSARAALAALSTISRLLCTVRSLLAVLPGGKAIAKKIKIPDPADTPALDEMATVLESLSAALLEVIGLVEQISLSTGLGILPPPSPFYECPLDASGLLDEEEPPTPTIDTLSPATLPANLGGDFWLRVTGSGFTSASVVRWNDNELETMFASESQLSARVPRELIAEPSPSSGEIIVVFNGPPGLAPPGTEGARDAASNAATFVVT